MLELKDLKETKFYQEALAEGIEQGKQTQKLAMIPLLQELGLNPQQIAQRLELDLKIVINYSQQ